MSSITYNIETFDYKAHNIYLGNNVDEKMLYDVIEKLNNVQLGDELHITRNLNALQTSNIFTSDTEFKFQLPPINIYLSSFGGYCYAGLGVYDRIKEITDKYEVNIICSGYIMSMATIILQSATNRIARKNTTFMVHDIADSPGYHKLEDLKDRVDEDVRLRNVLDKILIDRSKLTVSQINEINEKKKDWYLNAEQALEYGLIDKII